jgi:uncharacterized protein (TIGR04551 family)
MPWHFGRGMVFNNGECQDCDDGTNVDRILAMTQIYGHRVALAWDWAGSGYTFGMTDVGRRDVGGLPLDFSQEDDVFQLMASIALVDDDRRFRERVDFGELAVNYGLQLVYRRQNTDVINPFMTVPSSTGTPTMPEGMARDAAPTREQLVSGLVKDVDALVFQPSLWFKLGYKVLTVELEASAVLGHINNAGPYAAGSVKRLTLEQFGWILATELKLYRNALFLGFETGGATGDSAEDVEQYLNYRWKLVPQPEGDTKIQDFKFNSDYHVDQILFRHIIGTVTNAIYFKPSITYWLDLVETRQIGLSGSLIYSLAPTRVSTPGNALSYGIEADLGLSYRNPADGFYAGLIYGVLWPMGALDRGLVGGGGSINDFVRREDASTAQLFRVFLGIKF